MIYDISPPTKSRVKSPESPQDKPQAKPRFEARKKPGECPACSSDRIALIVYGLPPPDPVILKLHDEGLLHYGGTLITGDDPRWHCKSCNAEIYKSAPHQG